MIHIADATLDRWLQEDAPSLDLTTTTLGLDDEPGTMRFVSRDDVVACGTEVSRRILVRLGAEVTAVAANGTHASAGSTLLEARGTAAVLHLAWKPVQNILEHASGIATRTRRLVDTARSANPRIEVVATRKGFPGTRDLAIKAVVAGGALPHRLGLSETILAFEQHRVFCGGFDAFVARIPAWKARVPEKKILVEVASLDEAQIVAAAGVDGVQFDKVPTATLSHWVGSLRSEFPKLVLVAAGGITETNAAAHAATGVDLLATSSVFFGKPADIGVTMERR